MTNTGASGRLPHVAVDSAVSAVTLRCILLLALVSIVAVFWADWRHPVWFVAPSAYIDPWLYWGTGEDLGYLGKTWGSTYYFRRWTLVLPNYLAQHSLPPYEAQVVLRSALLFGICFFGGLFARLLTGVLSAGVVTAIGLAHFDFIVRNVGQSYTQGTGLLLFLASACLLVRWDSAKVPAVLAKGAGLGVLLGLLFVTYPWTGYLWFALAVLGGYQLAKVPQTLFARTRTATLAAIGCAVGFAAIVVLDLQVAGVMGREWPNVLSYSYGVERGLSSSVTPVDWGVYLSVTVPRASSFVIVGLAVSLVSLVFAGRLGKWAVPLALSLFTLSATFLADPLFKSQATTAPQTIFYLAAFLVVAVSALLSSAIRQVWQGVPSRGRVGVTVLICAGAALLATYPLSLLTDLHWATGSAVTVGATVAYAMVRIFGDRASVSTTLYLVAVLASTAALVMPMEAWKSGGFYATAGEAASLLTRLSREHRSLMKRALQDDRRIWILDQRPHLGWSTNVSAAYGRYSAFVVGYPAKAECNQVKWLLDVQNSTVVVYGATDASKGAAQVRALAEACEPVHLAPRASPPEGAFWFDISRSPLLVK